MNYDTIKTRLNSNFSLLCVTITGYIAIIYIHLLSSCFGFDIPFSFIAVGYFALIGVYLELYSYVFFISFSFLSLALYFSLISCGSLTISCVFEGLSTPAFAIRAYSFILIPFTFLGVTIDFYTVPKEVPALRSWPFLKHAIAVLIKKDLIVHRYKLILDAFYMRGLETRGNLNKYRYIFIWLIPLVVTTLMEGLESFEYNKMLGTNIDTLYLNDTPKQSMFKTSLIIVLFVILIGGIIFLQPW